MNSTLNEATKKKEIKIKKEIEYQSWQGRSLTIRQTKWRIISMDVSPCF